MRQDLDARLRSGLAALADEGEDDASPDFANVRRQIRSRRLRARVAASIALTVAVFGVVAVPRLARPGEEAQRVATRPSPAPAPRSWTALSAPAPIDGREGHSAVVAGRHLIIWGGSNATGHLRDGAIYDMSADRWRTMAPPPIAGRAEHAAVWDGQRMVVWGGHTDRGVTELADGASYDPSINAWRKLPPAPLRGRRYMAVAWTGVDLLVYGGSAGDGASVSVYADGAAYDSESGEWRLLPPSPLGPRSGAASVMADGKWLVWGGFQGDTPAFDGAVYDGVSWTSMPPLPVGVLAPEDPVAVWTGAEMLVFGRHQVGTLVGVGYQPATRTWRTLSSAPFANPDFAEVAWAGDRLVAWSGNTAFEYFPLVDRWRTGPNPSPLSPRSGCALAWSGTEVVVWGGVSLQRDARPGDEAVFHADGASYTPAPPIGGERSTQGTS